MEASHVIGAVKDLYGITELCVFRADDGDHRPFVIELDEGIDPPGDGWEEAVWDRAAELHAIDQLPYRDIAQAEAAMLSWINAMTAQITDRYPEAERLSWPDQEAAARDFLARGARASKVSLEFLDALLNADETRDQRASRIVDKAEEYRSVVGLVVRLRGQTMAALRRVTDPAGYGPVLEQALEQAAEAPMPAGLDIAIWATGLNR